MSYYQSTPDEFSNQQAIGPTWVMPNEFAGKLTPPSKLLIRKTDDVTGHHAEMAQESTKDKEILRFIKN